MAQSTNDLSIKREFAKAYQKGTRLHSGKVSEKYWQNRSEYFIKAKISGDAKTLSGWERITYHNNSPDSLDRIVLRVAQDLYKKGVVRNQAIRSSDITEGVEIQSLTLNATPVNTADRRIYQRVGTNVVIKLFKKIPPRSSINLSMEWSFMIPQATHLRMGKADEGTAFIAYWYPEVAVYDDINGWDMDDYQGLQEMYHDANSYDVSIEISNQFGVWATGELQNPEAVFEAEFIKKMKTAFVSDSITRLLTAQDYTTSQLPFLSDKPTKVWRFTANPCPDFAFAFGNRFLWDATSLTLSDGRRISISAVYRPEAQDFPQVAQFARNCLHYLSNQLPAVPYPYPQMTVVHGSPMGETGGMEFPMICNDPSAPNRGRAADVTSHEIAHTYFPFYVLTNERRYAWMDEGWAAFLPAEYMKKEAPESNRLSRYVREMNVYTFGFINDLPIVTPTNTLNVYNYFGASYSKPALAYQYLREELGNELFVKTLKAYIEEWKWKHPIPYDFFFTFNKVSGRNLNWFWKKWFFESNDPDLTVRNVQNNAKGSTITIARVGELPVPIALNITYHDNSQDSQYYPLGIWADGKKESVILTKKKVKKVVLGNEYIPDLTPENNSYEVK